MESRTFDGIETKPHASIVWRVHDFLVANQGQFFHTEDLCLRFYGEYNTSTDREMRLIIEEITNDRTIQKIIIGTNNGYIHPRRDQMALAETYIEAQQSAARKLFYRVGSIIYRLKRDKNYKLKIGKYDSDIFLAFLDTVMDEMDKESKNIPPREYRKGIEPPVELIVGENQQVEFVL